MKKTFLSVSMVIAVLLFWTCNDKSVNNDTEAAAVFKQGKCGESFLKRSSSPFDSVFTYSFENNLILDFSVSGNCCPDSNRFSVSHLFNGDTLNIVVADTALNGCRCMCPYMIEADFQDLSKDSYLVICERPSGYLLHKVRVYR